MNTPRIILPKSIPDLMNPARIHDLGRAYSVLNAFAGLRMQINSRTGQSIGSGAMQVSGGAALLSIVATIGSGPVITMQPVGGTFMAPHTLTIAATGATPITYQWQSNNGGPTYSDLVDGGIFSGVQTASLLILSPFPGAPWGFRCLVTNPSGQTMSDTVFVTLF